MTFIKTDVSGAIATHAAITTNIHGTGAGNNVASDNDISTHAAVKQNVHGVGANDIADVADISTHAAVKQNVHGVGANDIADVADISTHAAVTTNIHGTGAGNDVVGDDELSVHAKISGNSFTGNNTVNRAIAHNLGYTPNIIIMWYDSAGISVNTFTLSGSGILASQATSTSISYAITNPDSTNFYVGNAAQYERSGNGTGKTMYWMCI